MSIEREQLFAIIKQRLPDNVSFIDEIADVLDISYDAMYRRLKGKTVLSFSEAIQIAKHYKVSLNGLYDVEKEENLFVLKKSSDNSFEGLTDFFDVIANSAAIFSKFKNPDILYAAKEIPIYYLPDNVSKNTMIVKDVDLQQIHATLLSFYIMCILNFKTYI